MRDYFTTLAGHNRWANRRLFGACAALSDADYRADRGAFFGSLHATLNHILVADRLWMGRLSGENPGISFLDTILYDDRDRLQDARETEDSRIADFIATLSDERLRSALKLPHDQVAKTAKPRSTWCWPTCSTMQPTTAARPTGFCRRFPADPPPLDLIYFLRDPKR